MIMSEIISEVRVIYLQIKVSEVAIMWMYLLH